MTLRRCAAGLALMMLTAPLAGCSSEHWFEGLFTHYPLPGPLHYGKCGPDAHTEAYPYAHDERHAYGCKSNENGFLESSGQGDQRRN
jgi:hypothetical protein